MNRYARPLPPRIAKLDALAVDLWWSWHPEARRVFRRLDYGAWRATELGFRFLNDVLTAFLQDSGQPSSERRVVHSGPPVRAAEGLSTHC